MKRIKNIIKRAALFGLISVLGCLGILVVSHSLIEKSTDSYIYEDMNDLPGNKVGVVLGTSKSLSNGHSNLYFQYRIQAAVKLYQQGKIKYIIVSGDNSTLAYNEPQDMRKALVAHGIPTEVIYSDYAGFGTLDSMIRASKVFGQQSFTVISQDFHNKRAVYIARRKGLKAVAYNAKDVSKRYGYRTRVREWFARVKAILDVHVLFSKPKFLGDQIHIG